MDEIDTQIQRLKSPNKNVRYDSCEQLKVADDLPLEAILALEAATLDADTAVAHAARRALFVHRQAQTKPQIQVEPAPVRYFPERTPTEKPAKSKQKSYWLYLAIFVVVFLAIGGESVELTCSRSEPGGRVDCLKQSRLLWLIPLGQTSIRDVRAARLGESSYDGNPTYRVELLSEGDYVPLTSVYTSGYFSKNDAVVQINQFIKAPGTGTLDVAEPGLLSLENLICFSIWLPVMIVLNYLWKEIKSESSRPKLVQSSKRKS